MPWTNYHSHTHYCDGSEAPELYLKNAIEQKMIAYGFSTHAPIGFETVWNIADTKLEEYLREINLLREKYSDKIQTYLGLEIDYIPGQKIKQKLEPFMSGLDYFIGSIHFAGKFEDGEFWNIDHNKEEFDKGLDEIYKGDFKKASYEFYEITRQMIQEDNPDIIGHLDKIKMFNNGQRYFVESESWYKNQVVETIRLIKKTGTIVEINTRGYYRYNQEDLYPSMWIIEMLAEEGVPLMLNSDTHKPHEITEGFSYAAKKLKSVGVKWLWALVDKEWRAFEYNEGGLIL